MTEAKVSRERLGHVAVLTLDGPPVNAFSLAMREALYEALQWAAGDEAVQAVVLAGAGRGFSAGGDIREFGTPRASELPGLSSHIHVAIERMPKPVIAVLQGFALGGGLETLLACHYRVAEHNAVLGLPEVGLGTLPLSATQRLPRVLGIAAAVRLMLDGQRQTASAFTGTALFDRVVPPGQGLATACAWAAELAASAPSDQQLQQLLVRHRPIQAAQPQQALAEARQYVNGRTDAASQALLQAVEAAVNSPDFDAGMDRARALYDQLMAGPAILQGRERFLATGSGQSAQADPNAS